MMHVFVCVCVCPFVWGGILVLWCTCASHRTSFGVGFHFLPFLLVTTYTRIAGQWAAKDLRSLPPPQRRSAGLTDTHCQVWLYEGSRDLNSGLYPWASGSLCAIETSPQPQQEPFLKRSLTFLNHLAISITCTLPWSGFHYHFFKWIKVEEWDRRLGAGSHMCHIATGFEQTPQKSTATAHVVDYCTT